MRNRKELREYRRRIGSNIRKIRTKHSLSLKNLEERTHLHIKLLSAYEEGKRTISIEQAALIAKGLQVPIGKLFE